VLVDGWVCSDAVVFGVVGDDRVCQVKRLSGMRNWCEPDFIFP